MSQKLQVFVVREVAALMAGVMGETQVLPNPPAHKGLLKHVLAAVGQQVEEEVVLPPQLRLQPHQAKPSHQEIIAAGKQITTMAMEELVPPPKNGKQGIMLVSTGNVQNVAVQDQSAAATTMDSVKVEKITILVPQIVLKQGAM